MAPKIKKAISPVKSVVPNPVVYIGPNLGGDLPMTQYTVYKNGLPAQVQQRFDSDSEFVKLFIPVETLAGVKQKLKDPASNCAKAFMAVVKSQKRR